jgi:cation transport ATPase
MQHHADVAHHVKGRIRVRMPKNKRDHATLEKVKRSISPMHGVKSVDVNSSTGSVIVHYDANKHADFPSTLAHHAEANNLFTLGPPPVSEVDEMVETIEKEAEFLAEHSETARAIVEFVKGLNREVKKATNNNFDLQVLLPLGLAAYAFLGLEAEVATPLWVTLGLFSFNSFVSLHHAVPATMEVATEDTVTTSGDSPRSRRTPRKGGR